MTRYDLSLAAEPATVVVRPSRASLTTFQAVCRHHGIVSTSTDADVPIQVAIDHVSDYQSGTQHDGGTVLLSAHRYTVDTPIVGRAVSTGAGPSVWPVRIVGEGAIQNAPAIFGDIGGTCLIWGGGSAPTGGGAVLNLDNDCHGYAVHDLGIDGNDVATYCAKSAGRRVRWDNCGFVRMAPTSSGRGLWITNGSDTSGDRYVQQRVVNCWAEGNSGGIGFYVADSAGGSSCTDGRVEDVQTNGCNDGGIYLGEGGWGVRGGHLTQNSTGGARTWGMHLDAGFLHVTNVYVDIVAAGENIRVTNNNFTITNCFLIANNKSPGNTHPAIDVAGNDGSIVGNSWGGTGSTFDYFLDGTSGAQVALVGNTGPSGSIGTAIYNSAMSSVSAANNISY